MLSVLFGEQYDVFRQILEFYKPHGSKILDLTYGKGTLWKSASKISAWEDYDVTTVDIDKTTKAQYHCDFAELPPEISEVKRDILVYDPPYKYESPRFILQNRKAEGWKDKPQKTLYSLDIQKANIEKLNNIALNLLKDDGILIVKIMDTRYKGKLIPAHCMFINGLTNFEIKDILIYIKLGVGIFVNKKSAQTAHGFFLIFKKKEK